MKRISFLKENGTNWRRGVLLKVADFVANKTRATTGWPNEDVWAREKQWNKKKEAKSGTFL